MCYVLTKQNLILAPQIISVQNRRVSVPTSQKDLNSKGGGKMVFVREIFITKQMKNFETIYLDLTIVK